MEMPKLDNHTTCEMVDITQLIPNPRNPNTHPPEQLEALAKVLQFQGWRLPLCVSNQSGFIVRGHGRLEAGKLLGVKQVPVLFQDYKTPAMEHADLIADKRLAELATMDNTILKDLVAELDTGEIDLGVTGYTEGELENLVSQLHQGDENEHHEQLATRFVVPPFSVLDTRQGYWKERKDHWRALIGDMGESRQNTLGEDGAMLASINNGVSLLDPVLAELANLWFGIPNGKTFDPFAGDTIFGWVSQYLGNKFTGIELRQEQCDLNNARIGTNGGSKYICDDGLNVANHIEQKSQDLLFSCPPYFDLEIYSNLQNDASNQKSFGDFMKIIDQVFANAIRCLKDNRFAVIVVGDIRNKTGFYYNFIDQIKSVFNGNGCQTYNELILVNTLGTLPQRAGRLMQTRKIGKTHQNVLVFYKGDPKEIKTNYPKIEINETENL